MRGTRLFTDADNTLWDTNSVYAAAQIGLLRDVGSERPCEPPTDADAELALVRDVDQRIAGIHPDHLRYPAVLLARAIASVLAGQGPEHAVRAALRAGTPGCAYAAAVARYEARLAVVPALREGVREGLDALRESRVPVVVLTETSLERCGRLIDAHGLAAQFLDVMSVRKNVDAYRALRRQAEGDRLVMVGDQLDRDVEAAKQSGFTTIFFPSGFVPAWNRGIRSIADHEILRFDEIPALLLQGNM